MLLSFGIGSAADVTPSNLDKVATIGPKLAAKILLWRSTLERAFGFNAGEPVDKQEIEKIDRELWTRSKKLEQSIFRCAH